MGVEEGHCLIGVKQTRSKTGSDDVPIDISATERILKSHRMADRELEQRRVCTIARLDAESDFIISGGIVGFRQSFETVEAL